VTITAMCAACWGVLVELAPSALPDLPRTASGSALVTCNRCRELAEAVQAAGLELDVDVLARAVSSYEGLHHPDEDGIDGEQIVALYRHHLQPSADEPPAASTPPEMVN
jgi:hypothetical protein